MLDLIKHFEDTDYAKNYLSGFNFIWINIVNHGKRFASYNCRGVDIEEIISIIKEHYSDFKLELIFTENQLTSFEISI